MDQVSAIIKTQCEPHHGDERGMEFEGIYSFVEYRCPTAEGSPAHMTETEVPGGNEVRLRVG